MCVNLSLIFLAVINVSQSFCFTINNIIILRSLAGLFNNLSTFTKSFILGLFSHKQHKKILNYISMYQNFFPVIALLSGLIYEFLQFGQIFKNQDENSIFNNFNKYSPITLFISFLCIITLVLGMVKFKFKMVIPKRRTQFHEQIELHLDSSQRKESVDHQNQNPFNSNIFDPNKFSSSPLNKPSREISNLDIYSANSKNVNESGFNSHPVPNSNQENNILPQMSHMANTPHQNFSSNVSSKNSVLETVDTGNEKQQQEKHEQKNGKYNQLNEESHISKGRFSGRKIISITDFDSNKDEIENPPVRKGTKEEDNSKLEIKIPPMKENYTKFKSPQNSDQKIIDTNNYRSSNLKILTENTSKSLLGINENISKLSFSISMIFSFLQICDVVVYNIFLLNLILPDDAGIKNKNFSILEISFYLAMFHFIYSLISTLIYSLLVKWFIKSLSKLNFLFKLFTVVSCILSLFVFMYDYQYMKSKEYIFTYSSFYLFIGLILLRNLCLTVILTCYNLLVYNIPNTTVKDKIQTFQKYFSFLFRGVFLIFSCFAYDYFVNDYISILILLGAIPTGFLIVNWVLLKKLNNII
jgi:hypothetical protein